MTFVTTQPEIMTTAAGQLTGLGTRMPVSMARAIVPQAFHLDVFEHTALAAYDMRDGSPGRHS